MKKAQPLLKAEVISDQVIDYIRQISHTDQYDKHEFQRLLNLATDLQGKGGDVVGGCRLRAQLYSATGKFDDAEAMFKNIKANGYEDNARIYRAEHLVNHGYASLTLADGERLFSRRADTNFVRIALLVLIAGGFCKVAEKLAESVQKQEVLSDMTNEVITLAQQGAKVMGQLGLADAEIAAMIDEAGEMLRSHRLYWQNNMPDMHLLTADKGGPALSYHFRVDVTPSAASKMSWDLCGTLVEKNLDRLNVSVGFLGTRTEVHAAA